MTRTLLKMGVAAAFMVVSVGAWAAGPNDGPKYPNTATNKHYTDQRIMDHNNAAPRYAATTASSQKPSQASRAGQRTRVVHVRRAPAVHANAALAHHG